MRILIITLILILPFKAFAIFCPSNFNNIDFGNSIEEVLQQCGEPASQRTYSLTTTGAQQWDYYVRKNPLNPMTSKMSIVFKDNRAINISVNRTGLTNNLLCQQALDKKLNAAAIDAACNQGVQRTENVEWTALCGPIIRLGSSPENVEAACGAPDFVTKSETSNQLPPTQITEYKYNVPTPNILIFENGILKDRK